MSRLSEAAKSVPAASSAADAEPLDTNTDLAAHDTPPAGEPGDKGGEPDGDKGRSIENVRGEMLRKLEKSNNELKQELLRIREDLLQARQQYGVPAPTAGPAPTSLDEMSISQLETMRASVPDAQKAAFEQYLQDRKINAKVDERVKSLETNIHHKAAEQRYNEQAFERWPQLRDSSSELYREADRILGEMGVAASSPRAVLDAANEAGLSLSLSPATGVMRTPRTPGHVAPGRSSAPTSPSERSTVDRAEQEKIAASLASAMPGGTFTKEQLARIAERQKAYAGQFSGTKISAGS